MLVSVLAPLGLGLGLASVLGLVLASVLGLGLGLASVLGLVLVLASVLALALALALALVVVLGLALAPVLSMRAEWEPEEPEVEPEDDDKAVRTSEKRPALTHQTRSCMRRLLALPKSLPQLLQSMSTTEGTATATAIAATAVLPSVRGCVAPAPASIAPTSRGKFGGGRC